MKPHRLVCASPLPGATRAPLEEQACTGATDTTRKLRVLVAEDHPINLQYMSILLDKMGHEATFCENGQEALQRLEQTTFDVVLMDYHMPVLDGLATTAAIRALKTPVADIKVVLVTADVENDTRMRAQAVGVNEFASKPLQADDLRRAFVRCGLLDDPPQSPVVSSTQAPLGPRSNGPFPVPSHSTSLRLPDLDPAASALLDSESYAEILSMMPKDSLCELLKTVFEPPEGTVHVLAQAILEQDREAIGYNAHKLKGTAMLMGFRALVKTSAQIEQIATQTEAPVSAELGQLLLREAALTQQALQPFELRLAA